MRPLQLCLFFFAFDDGDILVEADKNSEAKMVAIDPAELTPVRTNFNTLGAEPYRFHDQSKIVELEELMDTIAQYKSLGRKVVFTNGCFDILHTGHVTYLEAARKEGDCLIVGLNSDSSIRSIKGPECLPRLVAWIMLFFLAKTLRRI